MIEKVPGKIGITSTLLEPAREIAMSLREGEIVMLEQYPAMGVCPQELLPEGATKVFEFEEGGKSFCLFEIDLM